MREQDRKAQETRKALGPRLGRSKSTTARVYSDLPVLRRARQNRLPGERGW